MDSTVEEIVTFDIVLPGFCICATLGSQESYWVECMMGLGVQKDIEWCTMGKEIKV